MIYPESPGQPSLIPLMILIIEVPWSVLIRQALIFTTWPGPTITISTVIISQATLGMIHLTPQMLPGFLIPVTVTISTPGEMMMVADIFSVLT